MAGSATALAQGFQGIEGRIAAGLPGLRLGGASVVWL